MSTLRIDGVEIRPIDGFAGYFVGEDGSVWSARGHGHIASQMKRLSPRIHSGGYLRVNLCEGGRKVDRYIHRLVLFAFVGPPLRGQEACHGDGDRKNNRLSNLRWDTRVENFADICRQETRRFRKLTMNEAREIRRLHAAGETQNSLSAMFRISQPCVSAILLNQIWQEPKSIEPHQISALDSSEADEAMRPVVQARELRDRVVQLSLAGAGSRRIAKTLEIGRSRVLSILRSAGLSRPSASRGRDSVNPKAA